MRFLLDTHVLLWVAGRPELLSANARALIEDRSNGLVFSAVDICEVAVKRSLDKLDFRTDPDLLRRELLKAGYEDLPVTSLHAVAVASLPWILKDPFDRLLIAQAMAEGNTLLTADKTILRYPGSIQRA